MGLPTDANDCIGINQGNREGCEMGDKRHVKLLGKPIGFCNISAHYRDKLFFEPSRKMLQERAFQVLS